MKHLEWKNFHSEILFSLLSRSYTVSDLQVTENFYKQFYNFIGLTEDETNVFCSDLENIEYTTNEKQTFLFIQRIDKGVLFENNLDTKYSDETELKKNYKRVISDGTNIIKIVRFFHKKDDCKKCSYQLNNSVFITAEQLSDFFIDWCYSQEYESLAIGMYRQYAKKLLRM